MTAVIYKDLSAAIFDKDGEIESAITARSYTEIHRWLWDRGIRNEDITMSTGTR